MAESGLLPQIVLGPVLAGIGDAHPRVRYAALTCLGQMTEDYEGGGGSFQGTFHAQLLPLLVQSLGGPNASMSRLQAAAAGALITFCNPTRMHAEWLYAPAPTGMGDGAIGMALLEALSTLVRTSASVVVREEALSAVGCVAQVLGPGFGSFYSNFVPLAMEILMSTSPLTDNASERALDGSAVPNMDTLRGKAMEAIALIGQAVGIDVFRADAHQASVIKVLLSEQKTTSRDPGNPQSTYTLQTLARIAGVMREEFLPYLSEAVTPLLAALSTDAEIKVSSASNIASAKEEMEAAGLTALEMDLRGVGRQLFGVNTSLMQAKESACKTLYQYTDDLGDGFAPHAAGTLAVVLPNLGPRNAVAVQVVSAAIVPKLLGMASRRAVAVVGGGEMARALVVEAQAMLDAAVDALSEVISRIAGEGGQHVETGGDMEPACIAADSLASLLGDHCKAKDPSPLVVTQKGLMTAVTVLRDAAIGSMRRSEARAAAAGGGVAGGRAGVGQHHPLAGMTGAVDSAELEEQEEWEEDLLTSAVDGVGWMIKGGREAFLPTFESMLKPLVLPLLRQEEGGGRDANTAAPRAPMPPSQRSFGLCMCIDVLEHCGPPGRLSVFPALLPALFRGCHDEVSSTRQACAYGLGVAAEFGGEEMNPESPEALRLLLALVAQGRDSDEGEELEIASVTDNAVSAAFRVVFGRHPVLAASFSGHPARDISEASVHLRPVLSSLLGELPLKADVAEGRDCHRRIVNLALARDELLLGGSGGYHVAELLSAMAGMMSYQPSPQEEGGGAGESGCCRRGDCGLNENEDELCARQLVDKETRETAEKAVLALKEAFPAAFEKTWAGLGVEKQRALQVPTSST
ncbi:unnamed protein product [Laminaria digitata]